MIDIFKYEKRADYPHMNKRDKEIWDRFIDKYPDAYKQCQYDFHVGDAPAFNTLLDDGTDANQDKLYRLRIDVIAASELGVDIIEVKPSAGPATIGQLESYWTLYKRDEEPAGDVGMLIVTDVENPNMSFLCRQKGIRLVIV